MSIKIMYEPDEEELTKEPKPISEEAWPVLAVESIMLDFRKSIYENMREHIVWTFTEYPKANPEGFEIWRQQYEEGLTVAMLQLAENLSEQVKREVRSCCSTTTLRAACRTGR